MSLIKKIIIFVMCLNKCIYHLHLGLFPLILHEQSARFQGVEWTINVHDKTWFWG